MSTRRTRRGTLLEGDSRGKKIKQNNSKKQSQPLSGEVVLPQEDEDCINKNKVSASDSNCCVSSQDPLDHQTPVFNKADSPLTKRNVWESLNKDVKKKEELSSNSNDNDSTPRKVLNEMVNYGNAPVNSETPKKARKPEILVSLLENEAYPSLKLKAKSDEKQRDSDENKRAMNQKNRCVQSNKFREGDTFPNSSSKHVCFFPYCEHHSKETFKTDFLPISEVPEEPFLVSLSKDKNKELNMVTTSSGTLRVGPGCTMRRFLPSASCNKFPTGELSSGDLTDLELKKESKENKKLSSLLPELSSRGATMSVNSKQTPQFMANQGELMATGQAFNCTSSVVAETDNLEFVQDFEKTSGEFDENKVNMGSTTSINAQSPIVNTAKDSTQEQEVGYFSDFVTHDTASPTKSCKAKLFPLMEDLSDNKSTQALTTPAANIHRSTSINENNMRQCKEPVSLLKATTQFVATSPSSSTDKLGACSKYDSKGSIKRSERIRCKSKLPMEATVKLEKYVALEERQNIKKTNSKLKCADWITPQLKTSLKKKSLKKMKSISNKTKKGLAVKAAKTLKKKKSQMTRKVMDGIVQSIEETVLRASQDDSFDNVEKSMEMAAEECSDSLKNQAGVSYFDGLSNTVLPLISEKDTCVKKSASSSLDSNSGNVKKSYKNKGAKPHKNKQKVSKIKKYQVQPADSSKDIAVPSKHKQHKTKIQTITHTTSIESCISISDDPMSKINVTAPEPLADTNLSNSCSTLTSKRSRKKTKKAKEAFDEVGLAVFWEEDQPIKRSKSKKRINLSENDSCNGSTKRLKRNNQVVELMSDPVLEQHAFILWASENRSQVEMQHPTASACEVDSILSSRWCDVVSSVKGRFFLRAREALSDDDRHSLKTCSITRNVEFGSMTGLEQHHDRDPLFIEFVRLPVDKQRDMLRKWLKFFQRMLPKKEYIDFILTFKNACGESEALSSDPSKPVKRPRMRCLDPAHYRMLFDMIRLTRPRIIEVCKEKKGKEKKIVSQTYSMIIHKLVCGEPWPEANVSNCRSQSLTQVLLDLNIDDSILTHDRYSSSSTAGMLFPDKGTNVSESLPDTILVATDGVRTNTPGTTLVTFGPDHCSWNNTQNMQNLPVGREFPSDLHLDESDYACLNSDLAHNLFSGLSELSELPLLDQSMLDQVFLAPPRKESRCIQQRRGGGGHGGGSTGAVASSSPCSSSPALPSNEPSIFPKMNIHHPPTIPGLSPYHHQYQHMVPPSHNMGATILSNAQYFPRSMIRGDLSPSSLSSSSSSSSACSFRKDSLMDMHSYSINVDDSTDSGSIGNLTNLCMSGVPPTNVPGHCMKAYSKTLLGPSAKLSVQALHHSHSVPKGTACFSSTQSGGPQPSFSSRQQHPKVIPISAEQQHLMPPHMLSGSSFASMSSSKGRSHHMMPAKFNSQVHSIRASSGIVTPVSSCSRFYPQHGGLGSSSPLITSLSPLRNVKYQGQVSTKLYSSSPCTMMPYRPRLQLADTSGMGTASLCHRRTTHNVPISTTLNTFATARAQGGNIQQIKVCLPTQALKIPIAKLRGAKKSTYIKGKLKNVGLPPPGSGAVGNVSCMAQQGCKTTSGVLAKVLSFQVKSEGVCASAEYRSPVITEVSYASPKLSSTTSTFIGTMRPTTSQLECCATENNGYRNSKKVQLVSVDSRAGYSRPLGSTHTAVIVSPMSVHKRGSTGLQYQYSSASSATGSFRTTASLASNSGLVTTASYKTSPDHLNSASYSSRYMPKHSLTNTKPKRSKISSVSSCDERDFSIKPCLAASLEDEDDHGGSQFVVVGTRTTCLPIPKKRSEAFRIEEPHSCDMSTISSSSEYLVRSTAVQSQHWCDEDIQTLLQTPDSCNASDIQFDTTSTTLSPASTFHRNCHVTLTLSSEKAKKSPGHETVCSEESFLMTSKISEKVAQEKTAINDIDSLNSKTSVCEQGQVSADDCCKVKNSLQTLFPERRNNIDASCESANKDKPVEKRSVLPFQSSNVDENHEKCITPRVTTPDNESTNFEGIDESPRDNEECESNPILPLTSFLSEQTPSISDKTCSQKTLDGAASSISICTN